MRRRAALLACTAAVLLPAALPGHAVAATTAWATITNDTVWRTPSGAQVRANGGQVREIAGVFYWYGMQYNGTITDRHFSGIIRLRVYTSTDLATWHLAATPLTYDTRTATDVPAVDWFGRPSLIVGPGGSYVLALSYSTGTRNLMSFWTSSSPRGPFTWQHDRDVVHADGLHTMGDINTFQDDDGSGYALFVSDVTSYNSDVGIATLTTDHLGVQQVVHSCPSPLHHEALSVVKRGGWYYLMSSETRGWYSSPTWWKRARTMTGFACSGGEDGAGWSEVATVPSSSNSDNTQTAGVLRVQGTLGTTYVSYGDRWTQFAPPVGGTGRYGWNPLTFDRTGTPALHGRSSWQIDVLTGRWQ